MNQTKIFNNISLPICPLNEMKASYMRQEAPLPNLMDKAICEEWKKALEQGYEVDDKYFELCGDVQVYNVHSWNSRLTAGFRNLNGLLDLSLKTCSNCPSTSDLLRHVTFLPFFRSCALQGKLLSCTKYIAIEGTLNTAGAVVLGHSSPLEIAKNVVSENIKTISHITWYSGLGSLLQNPKLANLKIAASFGIEEIRKLFIGN
jgi:hypothetical protein